MDDATSPPGWDVIVVGGGLAGLTAAATAAGEGARTLLLEPHPPGGRARCDDRNGFTFNRGPRALYLDGAARPILESLGVTTDHGVAPPTKGAVGRVDGRLRRLPGGPASLLATSMLGPIEKVRLGALLARLPRIDPHTVAGQSFGEWLDSLGLSDRCHDVVAMVGRVATYAARPETVDAGAVLTNVQYALGTGVRYLDGGFQTLVDGLASAAERNGVEIRPTIARTIWPADALGSVEVRTADGVFTARTMVVSSGGPAAASAILGRPIGGAEGLTRPVTAACLELGLAREPRHPVLFGVDEPLYLSTHRSAGLAPPGGVVVHLMRYHDADESLSSADQRQWLAEAARQAGVADGDIVEQRFLADMTVSGGHPTAAGGGLAGRPTVADPARPGVLLAGDWVGPVGLLADAAVASGREAGRIAATRSVRPGTHGAPASATMA